MRPASTPPAPPPNRNAPTPSTRLLPRYCQLKFFELKRPANARKPQTPVPRWSFPGWCNPRGFAGVLVLARPSDREDGTRTRTPDFPLETQGFGGTQGNRDRAAFAVSNNRVN